jgi:hypothetical protein
MATGRMTGASTSARATANRLDRAGGTADQGQDRRGNTLALPCSQTETSVLQIGTLSRMRVDS